MRKKKDGSMRNEAEISQDENTANTTNHKRVARNKITPAILRLGKDLMERGEVTKL